MIIWNVREIFFFFFRFGSYGVKIHNDVNPLYNSEMRWMRGVHFAASVRQTLEQVAV